MILIKNKNKKNLHCNLDQYNFFVNKTYNIFKYLFLLNFIIFFNPSFSYADCSFGNLQIGDDVSKVKKLYGELSKDETDGNIQVFAEDVCLGENLEDVIIQIAIFNNVIAGFTFETEIADFETPLNEQNLYNYVVANYGAIKGSETKNWTGYKTWKQGGKEIYYVKYDQYGILEEVLLVTNEKYLDVFVPPDDEGFEEPENEN